ncbi:acyltransferase [Hymenobacter sp. BT186]|uniref:Acyltransferase n=1 Tax=Hymenobacter telluris TaxID=2816474 RepID=A0A939JBL5_9BACT|nr:acyltransferase [Hymenobacter telluris]MBO0356908.1 acyltransferase [Hymenobacter telluris]MBW3372935.1 acyltransferase [Hymenobacter norwichensis]
MHTNLKFNQVHILRAVACLGVVLNHAKETLWAGHDVFVSYHPIAQWTLPDYIGYNLTKILTVHEQRVFFFFTLSGFFLQHSVRNSFNLSEYARKRFLRLYPAYLLSLVLSGVVLFISFNLLGEAHLASTPTKFAGSLLNQYPHLTNHNFVLTGLFLATDNLFGGGYQLWSMPHEIIFCLLFPLYYQLKRRNRIALLALLVVAFCITHNRYVHAQIFFLAGMLYYNILAKGFTLPFKLPSACYYVAFGVLYIGIHYFSDPAHSHERLASILTLTISFIGLYFFLHREGTLPRPMKWLSEISYSVYLNHVWVLMLYYSVLSYFSSPLIFNGYGPLVSGAALSIGISAVFYAQVEKRIQAYSKQTTPAGTYAATPA